MSTLAAPLKKNDAAPSSTAPVVEKAKPSLRSLLGPMGFDAAEAALKPDGGGDKKPAPAPAVEAKGNGDAKTAKANPVVEQQRMQAYTAMRKDGANPLWMMALQRALGVAETGIVSLEVIDALRARQASKGLTKGLGYLDAATLKDLIAVEPSLGTLERDLEADKLGASRARGAGNVPEDAAVKAAGQGASYADYVKNKLKSGTFLGQPVTLHPEMHGRLAAATAYLQGKLKEPDPKKIAEKLGVSDVSHFRSSTPGSDQMHHATGFAIDINPAANQWLFNGKYDEVTKGETAITYAVRRAAELFEGDASAAVETGLEMTNSAGKKDTATLFAELDKTNANFKRYRELIKDKAALKAYVEGPDCPKAAAKRGYEYWLEKSAVDEKNLAKNLKSADGKKDKSAGFMDLEVETVSALRDAAGLRWGGADLGSANGDLMHFDGHFMSTAARIHAAKQGAIKKQGDKPKATKD